MTLWQTLFGFDGRIGRSTLWLSGLAVLLIDLAILVVVQGWIRGAFVADGVPHRPDGSVVGAGLGLVVVAVISVWTGLALKVKRCHDRGHSGWWLLIGLIPVAGAAWLLIELGFLPGARRRNRFGESMGVVAAEGPDDRASTAVLAPFLNEHRWTTPATEPAAVEESHPEVPVEAIEAYEGFSPEASEPDAPEAEPQAADEPAAQFHAGIASSVDAGEAETLESVGEPPHDVETGTYEVVEAGAPGEGEVQAHEEPVAKPAEHPVEIADDGVGAEAQEPQPEAVAHNDDGAYEHGDHSAEADAAEPGSEPEVAQAGLPAPAPLEIEDHSATDERPSHDDPSVTDAGHEQPHEPAHTH